MRVVITGATGFIGRALCRELHKDYEVIALSRDSNRAAKSVGDWASIVEWDGRTTGSWIQQADGALAIINLAGENVASGRWNKAKKAGILHSRMDTSRAVLDAVKQTNKKPKVIIHSSAIGYYGSRGIERLDENSTPGKGFLADVCRNSETVAGQIESLGVRCVIIRTGVVLGNGGGALPRIMQPFRFFLGGHIGSGRQWLSWISLDDEVAAIKFLIENEDLQGVFNLTAPKPITMKRFCRKLGWVIRRPSWLFFPGFIMRLALGEMAGEVLLSGQRVKPKRLLEAGFEFKHIEVKKALKDIKSQKKKHKHC
ncbi:MAG: TIGR01777 family oxidoreductase [Sedimentisphaerales bacterium]|nr:TIGR01777 family oxidoreductase [Sedimentisphaerales bacterium]